MFKLDGERNWWSEECNWRSEGYSRRRAVRKRRYKLPRLTRWKRGEKEIGWTEEEDEILDQGTDDSTGGGAMEQGGLNEERKCCPYEIEEIPKEVMEVDRA